MLKDITLGQFFPGDSILHRLDPRMKIICSILYIVVIFLCEQITSFALVLITTAALVIISRIPIKTIIGGIKPILFILIFTSAYNIFFYKGNNLIFQLGIIKIYFEGVMFALIIAVRIICMIVGASVILTYTTSPIMLTDGLERLLSPLAKIKLPVHEFAMMMTIALRFIPTLISETDKIMSAQKARGADFSSGGLIKRVKALVPIIVPLIISSFRRAIDLATAMECRCYRGGDGRTRMTRLHLRLRDIVMLLSIVGLGAAVVVMNKYFVLFSI